ncbi:hypothetical protein F5Y13DRAFT_179711 [Hypoxylon sp. FL1857]|nr:hypothetical protein F5Y13DRAFT_179711 [Hypoxylon sp. FL1857]
MHRIRVGPITPKTTKMPPSRCTLCQVPLKEKEPVFFSLPSSGAPRFSYQPYDKHDRLFETTPGYQIILHARCYYYVDALQLPPRFWTARRFSFQPPMQGKLAQYRDCQLRSVLVEKLNRKPWSKTLPNEIWHMIAKYVTFEFSFLAAREQAHSLRVIDSAVKLSCDVYAKFVKYEGIFYLQELSNSPIPTSHGGRLIFRGQSTRPVQTIYIAEDHLGVRGIKLVSSGSDGPLSPTPDILGVWWRRISSHKDIISVNTVTDALKVRDIHAFNSKAGDRCMPLGLDRFRWTVWNPPPVTVIDLLSLEHNTDDSNYHPRMSFFECNAPDLTGYCVAITKERVIAIHSHREGTDLSFYEDLMAAGRSILWVYMPIEDGEYVTGIGKFKHIHRTDPSKRDIGLTFTTSRERTSVFGNTSNLLSPRSDLVQVYSPPRSPTKIYFNTADQLDSGTEGIDTLGCENPQPPTTMTIPRSAVPMEMSYFEPAKAEFYSSCKMRDVAKIAPCVDKTHPQRLVIGMLLQYKDGHRECLGQVRLDWMVDPLEVGEASKLRIGMTKAKIKTTLTGQLGLHVTRNVATVTLSESTDKKVDQWVDVPWYGTLEWWFSEKSTEIKYHKKERKSGSKVA